MNSYLLDTNHLSPLVTPGHPLRERVLASTKLGHQFAIAAPAYNEFLFGIGVAIRAKRNWQEWELIRDDFFYYDVSAGEAEQAANLRITLRQQGRQLEAIDSMLAIIALRNDLTLLTTDKDFQAVPGLKQENWLVG